MDSLPHTCTYDKYGCGHVEVNCHSSAGQHETQASRKKGRTMRMFEYGDCPACMLEKAKRFGVVLG